VVFEEDNERVEDDKTVVSVSAAGVDTVVVEENITVVLARRAGVDKAVAEVAEVAEELLPKVIVGIAVVVGAGRSRNTAPRRGTVEDEAGEPAVEELIPPARSGLELVIAGSEVGSTWAFLVMHKPGRGSVKMVVTNGAEPPSSMKANLMTPLAKAPILTSSMWTIDKAQSSEVDMVATYSIRLAKTPSWKSKPVPQSSTVVPACIETLRAALTVAVPTFTMMGMGLTCPSRLSTVR
jgi:hypothetical protein